LQRELGSVIALLHLVQLGVGNRRVQRPAFDGLAQLGGLDAESLRELQGLGGPLDQDRHVRVHGQLHPAARSGVTEPYRLAADRAEYRIQRGPGCGRPGRQYEQLAVLGWALAPGHRGVHERHVRPHIAEPVRDLHGRRDADRAHLRPYRSPGERCGRAVEHDRRHGVGSRQHRNHHVRAADRLGG
jgi:hypothetical protein